jgi:hypothetical protein
MTQWLAARDPLRIEVVEFNSKDEFVAMAAVVAYAAAAAAIQRSRK